VRVGRGSIPQFKSEIINLIEYCDEIGYVNNGVGKYCNVLRAVTSVSSCEVAVCSCWSKDCCDYTMLAKLSKRLFEIAMKLLS